MDSRKGYTDGATRHRIDTQRFRRATVTSKSWQSYQEVSSYLDDQTLCPSAPTSSIDGPLSSPKPLRRRDLASRSPFVPLAKRTPALESKSNVRNSAQGQLPR